MNTVIILQHHPVEGPGQIESVLTNKGFAVVKIPLFSMDFPGELFQMINSPSVKGLVVMGGPMGVYDEDQYSFLTPEKQFIKRMVEVGKSVLGICLGSQLLASALGAKVYPGPKKEIGWYTIQLQPETREDPLFGWLWEQSPRTFQTFHWHGDRFDLPEGAVVLASSDQTPHQVFRYGNSWGILCHLEATSELIQDFCKTFWQELCDEKISPIQLLTDTNAFLSELSNLGKTVFGRWADVIKD